MSAFFARKQTKHLTIVPYDIFMVGLTILSVINVFMYVIANDETIISTI